jgi:hypothetical protein
VIESLQLRMSYEVMNNPLQRSFRIIASMLILTGGFSAGWGQSDFLDAGPGAQEIINGHSTHVCPAGSILVGIGKTNGKLNNDFWCRNVGIVDSRVFGNETQYIDSRGCPAGWVVVGLNEGQAFTKCGTPRNYEVDLGSASASSSGRCGASAAVRAYNEQQGKVYCSAIGVKR